VEALRDTQAVCGFNVAVEPQAGAESILAALWSNLFLFEGTSLYF
jgi:hypothetical protein